MSDAYFFGCGRDMGHQFFEPGFQSALRPVQCPWDVSIDASMQPGCGGRLEYWQLSQTLGPARLHHKDGWTMLSFWDRSVDKRSNSNGNFIFKGTHDFDAMMKLAAERFPEVLARLSVPLYLEEAP